MARGLSRLADRARVGADFLETSAAQAGDPEHAAAFRALQVGRPRRAERLVATALYDLATVRPALTTALLGRRLPEGMTYAGGGGHYMAYRVGGDVVKVHKKSVRMTEDQRLVLAERERSRGAMVHEFLGGTALRQAVEVAAHPVVRRARAVLITQPYCEYDDLHDIFPSYGHRVDRPALAAAVARYPGLEEQLALLCDGSLRMAEATGFAPDVLGRGNLGVDRRDGRSLVLIDLQPIMLRGHPIGPHTIAQLRDLRRVLAGEDA